VTYAHTCNLRLLKSQRSGGSRFQARPGKIIDVGKDAGIKGTLILLECKLVQPLWKTVWRLLKKLKTELPYDPAIPLLGI
jgi:hypothetical protein